MLGWEDRAEVTSPAEGGILLKIYSSPSYEKAASVLEMTPGAVEAHAHQATVSLRKTLSRIGP